MRFLDEELAGQGRTERGVVAHANPLLIEGGEHCEMHGR